MNLNYVAGIIDGEGYVSIDRNSKTGRSLVGKVVVSMATPIIPTLLHEQFGGNYRVATRKNPRQSKARIWALNGSQAVRFLKKILPRLILKREQAKLVLKLYQSKSRSKSRTHPSESEQRHQFGLYLRAKELCTRKGPRGRMNEAAHRFWE